MEEPPSPEEREPPIATSRDYVTILAIPNRRNGPEDLTVRGWCTIPVVTGTARDPAGWDQAWSRGRLSLRNRLERLRAKGFHIGQSALAAGAAWFVAGDVLGHDTPFFAPVAAVVSLGTSYSQRHRRVAEVTVGVAVGIFIADLLVLLIGTGFLQMTLIVALSMTTAILLDAGGLLLIQATVQSIVVAALVPAPGQAFVRWTDALIGGAVALAAATIVPAAPLRRPRDQAAKVLTKVAFLLRGAARAIDVQDPDATLALLRDARQTDVLVDELRTAADEGASVVRSSPFRFRHRGSVRKVGELVEPLDLALRNTRVLVRRAAVAAYRGDRLPADYVRLCAELADAVARELRDDRSPVAVQQRLVAVGEATSDVERSHDLSGEVILAQLRSIIADLLRVTGMTPLEATDAIPPLRRG
jgi:uncharacterized membrane protein YgaE (UPF0421/DUF939 family)